MMLGEEQRHIKIFIVYVDRNKSGVCCPTFFPHSFVTRNHPIFLFCFKIPWYHLTIWEVLPDPITAAIANAMYDNDIVRADDIRLR